MTEDEARTVLLLRAVDEEGGSPFSEALRVAAWREAEGSSDLEAFARRRAGFLLRHLPASLRALRDLELPPRALAKGAIAAAAAVGLMSNAFSLDRRIHVLANPVTALVLWNLAVYVAMVAAQLRRRSRRERSEHAHGAPLRFVLTLAARAGIAWGRLRGGAGPDPTAAARVRTRYAMDYAAVCNEPILARCEGRIHEGAIAFALGALAGIFVQGVAFEYRIEWGSTLASSPDTRALLAELLFFPARIALGGRFPDAAQLSLASSADGAPAAIWFSVFAITVAVLVLVPRTVLAITARLRSRRLARAVRFPAEDDYWRRTAEPPRPPPDTSDPGTLVACFTLDTDAATLLATLEAELVTRDIGATATGRFDALGRKKRWFERWRALVQRGFDGLAERERPRILDADTEALAAIARRVAQSANRFAPDLVLLELAAFEPYGPLAPGTPRLRERLGLAPTLGRSVREEMLARAARLLERPDREALALRSALAASVRGISGFYPKLFVGAAAGTAVGAVSLGLAAPLAAGLAGKALGTAGLAALKTGLSAVGGHAVVGAGLGAASGGALVAGGGALLTSPAVSGGAPGIAALTPASALLSGARIEVFLRRIVAERHRDASTFSAVIDELQRSLGRLRAELPSFRLDPARTTQQIKEREKVIAILAQVVERNELWARNESRSTRDALHARELERTGTQR